MKYVLDQYAFGDSNRCDPLEYAFRDRASLGIELGEELIEEFKSHHRLYDYWTEDEIENLRTYLPTLKSGEPCCPSLQNQSQTLTHNLRSRW
jgi:hypothetical protein